MARLHGPAFNARVTGLLVVSASRRFKTTQPDETAARPADLVDLNFICNPSESAVGSRSDLRQPPGAIFSNVYDWPLAHRHAFSRRIVGWRASASLKTEHMPWTATGAGPVVAFRDRLTEASIHHSDRGVSQYLSIRFTDRLAEAGIESFGWKAKETLATTRWPNRSVGLQFKIGSHSQEGSLAGKLFQEVESRDAGPGSVGITRRDCWSQSATAAP